MRPVGPNRHMSRDRWMALAFAAGSTCFLVGPFPGYLALVGPAADAVTFFVGSVFFTAGGALQVRSAAAGRRAGAAGRAAWAAAVVQSAGHALLQREHLPGTADVAVGSGVRPAGLAAGRVRVDLLPGLRTDRLPRLGPARLAAGAGAGRLVAARRQPAGLHLLRRGRGRGLPRPVERHPARPGGRQLDDVRRRRLLPGLRARRPARREFGPGATGRRGSRAPAA